MGTEWTVGMKITSSRMSFGNEIVDQPSNTNVDSAAGPSSAIVDVFVFQSTFGAAESKRDEG